MVFVWIVGIVCMTIVVVAFVDLARRNARFAHREKMAQHGFWRGREAAADLDSAEERAERAEETAVALLDVREGAADPLSERATAAFQHARELRDAARSGQ